MSDNVYRKLIIVAAVVFVFLCLMHFFSQRPVWHDEALILADMKNKAFSEIFERFQSGQCYPRVHLYLIKLFSRPLDYHLLAIRLTSQISLLIAFFVWLHIYRLNFKEERLVFYAIIAFACSYQMTYYSAEFKPYATGICTVALFCWFLHYQKQFDKAPPTRLLYICSCALPLLVFFSYEGIFVIWMIGYNYLLLLPKNKALWKVFLINAGISLACLLVLWKIDLRFSSSTGGLYSYWRDYFLSFRSPGAFFSPLTEGIREIGTWYYVNLRVFIRAATPFVFFYMFSMIKYGFKNLKQERFKIFTPESMFFVLFFQLVLFSIMRRYPFTGDRVTLFLGPFVFYLVIKGINSLRRYRFPYIIFLGYYFLFIFTSFLYSFSQFLKLYL